MSIQMLGRCGVGLLLSIFISGCSMFSSESDSGYRSGSGYMDHSGGCQLNPQNCMHEGSYETGERAYAEQEARRLNQAALQRLRRSSGR